MAALLVFFIGSGAASLFLSMGDQKDSSPVRNKGKKGKKRGLTETGFANKKVAEPEKQQEAKTFVPKLKQAVACTSEDCAAGKEALKNKQFKKAISYFNRGLNTNSYCAEAYLGIAKAELGLYQNRHAMEAARHALALDPDLGEAHLILAKCFSNSQQYGKAQNEASQAIEIDPKNGEAYLMRAKMAYFSSLLDPESIPANIEEDLSRAIELAPSAEAYEGKGVYLGSRKRVKEAVEAFTQSIAIEPTHNAYLHRSAAYSYLKKFDLALADLDQVTRMSPRDPYPFKVRAGIHRELGHPVQSLADYAKVIELTPKDFEVYYDRAKLLTEMKRYVEAIKDYSHIIQANPMDDDALLKRADVYFAKGDYEKALADYGEAIDLYPESAYAFSARSKVLRKLGKSDQADLDEKRALELKKAPAIKKI